MSVQGKKQNSDKIMPIGIGVVFLVFLIMSIGHLKKENTKNDEEYFPESEAVEEPYIETSEPEPEEFYLKLIEDKTELDLRLNSDSHGPKYHYCLTVYVENTADFAIREPRVKVRVWDIYHRECVVNEVTHDQKRDESLQPGETRRLGCSFDCDRELLETSSSLEYFAYSYEDEDHNVYRAD